MARAPNTGRTAPQGDPRDEEQEEAIGRALVEVDDGGMGGEVSLAVSLSRAEIDVQIATAKQYPRSMAQAVRNALTLATQDTPTAMECRYALPRGRDDNGKAKVIQGPSIRLAELVAMTWGNNRYAARVTAIDRVEMFVEAEGVYHDLETNSAISAKVRRRISDKRGRIFNADMIMVTGNAASSIALRNAIFRGIPRPVWRHVYEGVEKVIRGDEKTLGARRADLVDKFKALGVSPQMVLHLLGVKGEVDIGLDEFVVAAGFYSAIRNGEATVDELMGRNASPAPAKGLGDAFGGTGGQAAGSADHDADGVVMEQAPAPQAQPAPPAPPAPDLEPEPASAPPPSAPAAPAAPPPAPPSDTVDGRVENAAWHDTILGPAPADEPYHLESEFELDANGRRKTFLDGALFSSATIRAQVPVYTQHAPSPAPSPAPAQAAMDLEPPAPAHDEPDESAAVDEAAFGEFGAQLRAAEAWPQVKAALNGFRKTTAWAEAGGEYRRAAQVQAYEAAARLMAKGDPVSFTEDPSLFVLWILVAESGLVKPAYQKLIRSPAYLALADAQKEAIGDAVNRALDQA